MRHTMMSFPLTLVPILDRASTLYPNVEIVSRRPDRGLDRSTYGEVAGRARQLARALVGAGLHRGERVATLMWNHRVHLEAYFGIPLAGGVVHTLNLRLAPSQLAFIATHAGDRFLIVDDVLVPVLESFRAEAPFERIFVHHTGGPAAGAFEDYETFLNSARPDTPLPTIDEEDGAAMCYTSGTTGDPKGVVYSHRALAVHSLMSGLADSFALSHQDVLLAIVPMFHANAWGLPFTATMAGTKQVLLGPHLDAVSVLELLEGERVTISAGVPTVWLSVCERLADSARRWNLVPGLRVLSGGSAPPEALIRRLDAHGVRLIQAWGLTESTPLATLSVLRPQHDMVSDDERYAIRAQQGAAVPFAELRVCNEDGIVPRDGTTMGEAQLRGPCVAGSYFKMPELGDKWTADDWFRTGDVVTWNADGYVHVVDRTKDLIKSGGEWISSVDLENALTAHPGVREAAVIAVPHPKWGERPLAVVVPASARPTPEELNAMLRTKFSKWQLPDAYVFVDELPHTTTGKLLKTALRDRYGRSPIEPT